MVYRIRLPFYMFVLSGVLATSGCSADTADGSSDSTSASDDGESDTELEIPPDGYCAPNDEVELESGGAQFTDENLHVLTGCRVVRGQLFLRDVGDLSPLATLEEVGGIWLDIERGATVAPSLASLSALQVVHETLSISGRDTPAELDMPASLRFVGELRLESTPNVQRVHLPPNVRARVLTLANLPTLQRLDVDDTVVVESVHLAHLPALHQDASLQGVLQKATQIHLIGVDLPERFLDGVAHLNSLTISSTSMVDLRLFSDLRSLGSLHLEGNEQLLSAAGLEHVDGNGFGRLELLNNPALADLSALSNIRSIENATFAGVHPELFQQLHNLTSAGVLNILNTSGERLTWPPLADVHQLSIVGNHIADLGVPRVAFRLHNANVSNNVGLTDDDARTWLSQFQVTGELLVADNHD